MIKKVVLVISSILVSLILLIPAPAMAFNSDAPAPAASFSPAPAAGQLTILDSSVETSFPALINFKIKASSTTNITDIRLHYVIDRESYAHVTSESFVDFTPGNTVTTQWIWDMRQTGGLPTGAGIKYWWTVKDAGGNMIESTPASFTFDDNRYTWKSLTENKVTINWYNGDLSFARQLMTAAQDALPRLTQNTGAVLQKPVRIYIYASTQDLQGAMIFPQEWTGGSNFPEFRIITIGIDTGNLDWGKRALAHELTHQVVHQVTRNPYIELPTWFDEGTAMYDELGLDAEFVASLKFALTNKTLISVRSLASPFSADTNTALQSYAQSYSLIEFLITTYGQGKMLDLLNTFSQGSGYDAALLKVYGFDMDGLNTRWVPYVFKQYKIAPPVTASLPNVFVNLLNRVDVSIVLYPRSASLIGEWR